MKRKDILNNNEFKNLKDNDIYSLMLFILFKIKDIPEYSTLSDLIYILDKNSFLNLCEYFGGLTIKIPTIDDLEIIVYSFILYDKVDINNKSLSNSLEDLNIDKYKKQIVLDTYYKVKKVMSDYDFRK